MWSHTVKLCNSPMSYSSYCANTGYYIKLFVHFLFNGIISEPEGAVVCKALNDLFGKTLLLFNNAH